MYENMRALIAPWRMAAEAGQYMLNHPMLPSSYTRMGRSWAAGLEIFERVTRQYRKPEFGLKTTEVDGETVEIVEDVLTDRNKPFCRLLHFQRLVERNDPRVLIVAPMSGHYATLLRGTVEAMLPDHDVFITDWVNANTVPVFRGKFDLEDYITYVMDYIRLLGPDVHVVAVCQPAVPVLCAAALLAQMNDPHQPRSMTLMGGPIDASAAETEVTQLADKHPIEWFRDHLVSRVPVNYPGATREVYPGYIQLSSFMLMNLGRHMKAHEEYFQHLIRGDGESAERHRTFYDEYLAVMDVTGEFYLQTVDRVFIEKSLPNGTFKWRHMTVDPAAITKTALLTIEGELDDISAPGQTVAAHAMCSGLPEDKKQHHLQEKVGHYGIFNGGTWRNAIYPIVRSFIKQHN
ncbi:MAG: polyhydroxyalkanoate depolymerase [Alphaproteobacteria bacterium]|nr:polyhydroxyalkanoate depolymerase [Alphaproteobacteria bacterium]